MTLQELMELEPCTTFASQKPAGIPSGLGERKLHCEGGSDSVNDNFCPHPDIVPVWIDSW